MVMWCFVGLHVFCQLGVAVPQQSGRRLWMRCVYEQIVVHILCKNCEIIETVIKEANVLRAHSVYTKCYDVHEH